jgi:predicted TIM-barrel fold metal-dependent hydrolase
VTRGPRLTRRALLLGAGVAGSASWLSRRRRAHAEAAPALVVDVHTHNFNASDLPVSGFTAHFMPFLADFSREISDLPEKLYRRVADEVTSAINRVAPTAKEELAALPESNDWPTAVADAHAADELAGKIADATAWLVDLVGLKVDVQVVVRRAAQVVNLIAHSRAAITATMAATYPGVALFVPMLVDYDGWAGDKARSPLPDQIAVHGALARRSIVRPVSGARLHPFVAFDPLRSDGLDLVQTAVQKEGFIGVKVYPPVGFAPTCNARLLTGNKKAGDIDKSLDALYDYCTKNDVPITTHCASANEFGLGLRDLVAPHRWEPVLRRFPKLRLNLGHFGHMYGVDPKTGFKSCDAWIRQASYLMENFQNVYGDLSGSDLNLDATADAYARLLKQAFLRYPSVPKRLMYGSDWWLNRFSDAAPDYLNRFKASFAKRFPGETALLADVLGGNALRFLGFAEAGGGRAANGDRVARLYRAAGQPSPPWLSV